MPDGAPVRAAAPIRDAASVVLVRAGAAAPVEVWLQRRASSMAFAPMMTVFPGGGVSDSDRAEPLAAARSAAEAFGVSAETASALLRAGVRELEEETGVVVAAESLVPWAHWITPPGGSLRYDTRFFLAALPEGQRATMRGTEATEANWYSAQDALLQWREHRRELLPPTWSQLRRLAAASSLRGLFEDARVQTVPAGTGREFPGAAEYFARPALG